MTIKLQYISVMKKYKANNYENKLTNFWVWSYQGLANAAPSMSITDDIVIYSVFAIKIEYQHTIIIIFRIALN